MIDCITDDIPLKDKLISPVTDKPSPYNNKITVVGAGQVGIAVVISLLGKGITTEICLIDVNEQVLKGELLDFQHGASFINNAKITGGSDYSLSANSRLIVVTAGARQKEGETRLMLVQRNADIMKDMIPKLVRYSPNGILLLVTNPVDIMTYIAWKISGWPKNRVIGSGTNLDSSRFRTFIASRLGVAPSMCRAWIIGEHGDSSVPLWSSVNVAGTRLIDISPNLATENDVENWNELHQKTVHAAYEVIKLKGYTSWAIGLSCADICEAIIQNTNRVLAVSTSVVGKHGITKDVFISLPCILNIDGVAGVIKSHLTPHETQKLHQSANTVYDVQVGVTF